MPTSVTQYFKIDPVFFDKTGALDAILDIDTRLFIDPLLLKNTSAVELKDSYQNIKDHFKKILKTLAFSTATGDRFWREAENLLNFPEVEGVCIGYSSKGTSGRGIGPKLRRTLVATAKNIIDAGIKDPEIFELIGFFEENIGPDRISDMCAKIIREDLFNYSQNVFKKCNIKTKPIPIFRKEWNIPVNKFNGVPIILMPKDILRDLPIALDWDDVDRVAYENEQLRKKFNEIIGETWKQASHAAKTVLKPALLENKSLLEDLVKKYKAKEPKHYNFKEDRAGQIIWHKTSLQYAKEFPLSLSLPASPDIDQIEKVVIGICEKYKDLLENNNLLKLLYKADGRPKHEEAAQLLFYGIADSYCEANNLDLTRESNGGRGPVDFKVSGGYNGRVIVEVKLTTNNNLISGYEKQLPDYLKSEKSKRGIYLVIDVGASRKKIEEFYKAVNRTSSGAIKVIFVNAVKRPSPSKL